MAIQGWVFDLDGVLIDSEPIHMRSWREVLRGRGITLGDEWYEIGVGIPDARFWVLVAERSGLDPADAAPVEEKRLVFEEMIDREGFPLCPGVEPLLERLHPTYPLAVATSSQRSFLDQVLERAHWKSVFRIALSRDDVQHAKPDPEIYLKAAAGLGLDPRLCAAVEDSPTGLAAAAAAGMKTIAVKTNFSAERLHDAGLVVESLGEMERIMRFVEG